MDVETLKIDLIHWLTELKDTEVLKQLSAIKEGQDWWEDISESEKLAIDKGLAQLDKGKTIANKDVMAEVKAKYLS